MRRTACLAASLLCMSTALATFASPAQALEFKAKIEVDTSDMSARAEVSDDVFRGTYQGYLTGTGEVSCNAFGPHTIPTPIASGRGNPLHLSIPGTCAPYSGWMTYTLEWVGTLGTSGVHTVHCPIAPGVVICTPSGADFELVQTDH